ncbi:ABC transporter permease [Bacillota bacterium Meth-B3]|nr:ABC transporter permease [Christensenellaceae bacterium]MEA5069057.1 ABC transporter permease [Christensenellaceae bacterium]
MPETKRRGFSFDFIVKYGVYSIFVMMFAVFSYGNKNFLTANNILLLLQQSAPLLLGVIGMAFVMMDGGIDISAGSNMYLSAAVGALVIQHMSQGGVEVASFGSYALILLVALLVGALIGLINGFFIARMKMLPFIVTLIITSIARGLGMFLTDAKLIILNTMGFKLTDKTFLGISVLIYFALIGVAVFHYVMRYTSFGCQLKAQGNNHEAAIKLGINTRRNTMVAYVICGALCGLAGILSAGANGSVPSSFADGNEFIIIPAAVLGGISLFGGKGTIFPGSIIGILLIYTIVNGLTMMAANPYIYTIVRGLIIFLAVMVDSMNYKGELR